jgi:hypothetical protein
MALTTYTNGEVLTATSLNDNFTFAAANPPAVASGLTLINSTTISTAGTTSVNDVFSATYDNYKIFFNQTASSTAQTLSIRLRVSATDATTNYTTQRIGSQGASAFGGLNEGGTTDFFINAINSTKGFFETTLFSPFAAAPTKYLTTSLGENGGGLLNMVVVGAHTDSTSYTGFTLLATTGTISGTLKVYGLANS